MYIKHKRNYTIFFENNLLNECTIIVPSAIAVYEPNCTAIVGEKGLNMFDSCYLQYVRNVNIFDLYIGRIFAWYLLHTSLLRHYFYQTTLNGKIHIRNTSQIYVAL